MRECGPTGRHQVVVEIGWRPEPRPPAPPKPDRLGYPDGHTEVSAAQMYGQAFVTLARILVP